jgi:hypothetical protein
MQSINEQNAKADNIAPLPLKKKLLSRLAESLRSVETARSSLAHSGFVTRGPAHGEFAIRGNGQGGVTDPWRAGDFLAHSGFVTHRHKLTLLCAQSRFVTGVFQAPQVCELWMTTYLMRADRSVRQRCGARPTRQSGQKHQFPFETVFPRHPG